MSSVISPSELKSIIVCFLFDGTDKYVRMTLNAVNSFITTTPHLRVGLLFPKNYDETIVTKQVTDPSRVHIRRFETHFHSWNPTQYKLDIIKFTDEFSTIFWLDSDAIVYHDLTDLLWRFHTSPCKVAFMKDHVCYNPQFLNVWLDWRKVSDPFIPQASFMGFKKEIMPAFFDAWQDTWRTWIEPVPFMNYPNPVPSFPGSAFCTEQYALGMVLESDVVTRADVFELRRITFPLKGLSVPGSLSSTSASISLDFNTTSFSGSFFAEKELGLLEDKFKSFNVSWNTSWNSSWNENTSWNTSWNDTTSWGSSGSWPTELSFSFSTWAVYPEFSFSYSSWESVQTSFSGSFSGSFPEQFSFGSSSSAPGVWAPIDNIEGKIVHFYSAFYDQSQNWWQKNSDDVIPQINTYWDSRSQRPAYAVIPPYTTNSPNNSSQRQSPPRSPHSSNNNNNNNSQHSNSHSQQRLKDKQRDDEPGL